MTGQVSGLRRPVIALTALAVGALPMAHAPRAEAFCGFYVSGSNQQLLNKATRVALMRQGTRTVLSMSNDYEGPPEDFAMVVPVPVVLQQENVRTLPLDVFNHLEELTAPRLVEYWEQDPCYVPPHRAYARHAGAGRGAAVTDEPAAERDEGGVHIEARFVVGEYQVLVLSATESTGLETWLHHNHYNIPNGAAEALAPYVREQWKFFVARVDIHRVQRRAGGGEGGGVRLSPLRFHYDSPEFRLPVRLGLLNAGDAQDLIVYVLSPTSRFEVANYPNVFIPTNLDVADAARARFPELYARLFDYTVERAGGRVVVTEYAWATSSCDPCPTPPLQPTELTVLGSDVLGGDVANSGNMVVTRLHTRYNRAALTEDLVFREAPAVVGGRESVSDGSGRLEQGAQPSTYGNNFQARYAIRHPWTGPIACANPRRGIWGGPPGGRAPQPVAARDLADAPRGRIHLGTMIRSPIPVIHPAAPPPLSPAAPAPRQGMLPATSPGTDPATRPLAAGAFGALGVLAALLLRRGRARGVSDRR